MGRATRATLLALAVLLAVLTGTTSSPPPTEAFSKRIVRVGAVGSDVREMQGRLKFLGFYTGTIDGQFGWRSYWALRRFQYEFGLKVDGVLGPKTKLKLYNATRNWRPGAAGGPARTARIETYRPHGFTANDVNLMVHCVYGEARGEPYIGQVAIAAVILNRVDNPKFPKTPAAVIFQPGAFTAVSDGQIWLTPDDTARKAVQDALRGWDPTGGAIYYFNPATATSAWIWNRPQIKRIGKHIFCL